MKRIFTGAMAMAAVAVAWLGVGGAARADDRDALARCQRGAAADLVESVVQRGGTHQVNFPDAANPDNAIYPGDVVKVTGSGSVRYDAGGHTAGPGGIAVSAPASWPFPGFKEYSSVANFNNNPGGWLGGSIATSALASCTAAPGSHPVRLIYRINDPNLGDNGGQWTLRTQVWKAPGSVLIEGVELTQGIQTAVVSDEKTAKVPLIAGKRTFVRVYVRGIEDGRGALSGVRASMTVEGDATSYAPVNATSITASPLGSNRRRLDDSFLFELRPAMVAAGSRKLTVTVTAPPGRGPGVPHVRYAQANFGPSDGAVKLTVYGARYSYRNVPRELQEQEGLGSATWSARPVSAWEPLRATAENVLPLASLTIKELAPNASLGSTTLDCRARQGDDGTWGCMGWEEGRVWAANKVDELCPNGGCWIVLLQPEIDSGHHGAHFTTSDKHNHVINMQGERDANQMGLTLGHEIGHGLSLLHAPPVQNDRDVEYPRADGGMGPFIGLRATPTFQVVAGEDANGNTTAYDLMSYASTQWISPYSYCKALADSSNNRLVCPAATPR